MKREAPTAYQVPETLSVSETLKVPGNRHCFQKTDAIQIAHKFFVKKFPVHLNGPTSDLPRNEIEENRDHLPRSLPDRNPPGRKIPKCEGTEGTHHRTPEERICSGYTKGLAKGEPGAP